MRVLMVTQHRYDDNQQINPDILQNLRPVDQFEIQENNSKTY